MGEGVKNVNHPTRKLRSEIIRSAILTALLLVLTVLAIQGKTSFPSSAPQKRYWTDNIVDFLAQFKEGIAIALCLIYGIYRFVRIPEGIVSKIWTGVWAAVIPLLSFVAVEAYFRGYWHVGASLSYEIAKPFSSMFLLNMLLFYLFFLSLAFVSGSFAIGYGIASGFLMGIAIVNFYVQQFRGTPIVPWDFLSIRTAANVAGNFEYKIYWQMLLATLAFVFLFLTIGKMKARIRFLPLRIVGSIAAVMALVFVIHGIQDDAGKSFWGIDTTLFTPNVRYAKNGFWPAFLSNLSFLDIDKPEGYSVEEVERITKEAEEKYAASAWAGTESAEATASVQAGGGTVHPNIIVIMNEAFSDLAVLGDFNTSEDYMPNFRALMEEYTSGHLLVSVKGGNTANTEYEFLSGDSMAFLPEGSVVFQQYISSEIPTFATYLKGLGYETIGMHPYQGSGWERDRVYPLMGFDRFLDQGSFAGADKLRNYVSDKGAFDKVIELFENKEEGTSQFQFLVTMQNHSGYSPKDTDNGFSEEVMLTDAPVQSPSVVAAERYLTLIKYSDQAFGELIDYFEENVTEPTLIVMFGDHEPNDYVTNVIDDLVGNASFVTASDNSGAADATEESLEDVQKHYQVPFVIWNNFGLKKDESIDLTSVNYLGAILAQQAGLPMSAQQKFLRLMQKQIPALAAGAYVGEDGAFHSWSQRGQDEKNKGLINDYQMLEYNHLMDVKNRLTWVYLAPGTEQGTGSS